MADQRPPTQRPAAAAKSAWKYPPRPQRETVDERRVRQSAAALAAQVDLKREAAERRERKAAS
jgi:hypothetical protein